MILGLVYGLVSWPMAIFVDAPCHEKIQDYEGGAGHPKGHIYREIDKTPICRNLGKIPGAAEGLRKMKNYRAYY